MRRKQKIVWANAQVAREAGHRVPTNHLGHFQQPAASSLGPFEAEVGSLWILRQALYMITDPWAGSELEEGSVAYLSMRSYAPSPRSTSVRLVPKGTMAMFAETRRVSEWDGSGISRPARPMFIVDGALVAVVDPHTVLTRA